MEDTPRTALLFTLSSKTHFVRLSRQRFPIFFISPKQATVANLRKRKPITRTVRKSNFSLNSHASPRSCKSAREKWSRLNIETQTWLSFNLRNFLRSYITRGRLEVYFLKRGEAIGRNNEIRCSRHSTLCAREQVNFFRLRREWKCPFEDFNDAAGLATPRASDILGGSSQIFHVNSIFYTKRNLIEANKYRFVQPIFLNDAPKRKSLTGKELIEVIFGDLQRISHPVSNSILFPSSFGAIIGWKRGLKEKYHLRRWNYSVTAELVRTIISLP